MDAHLALVKTPTENEFVAEEVARPESSVWIGLRRTQGEFLWSDGSKADYTNWFDYDAEAVSQSGSDCASLLPEDVFFSWEVKNCQIRQAFVCERGEFWNIQVFCPLLLFYQS